MTYFPPPPVAYNQNRKAQVLDYCHQCGVTEDGIYAASIGWGNPDRTVCRPCSIHNEIEDRIRSVRQ